MIAGIRDKLGKDAPAKGGAEAAGARAAAGDEKPGAACRCRPWNPSSSQLRNGGRTPPAIIVIDTMLDAPKEVFDKYQRETKAAMKAGERTGEVKGFIMPDGRVFIVADAATDARSVVGTVFHEVLSHHGLRGTFGKRIVQILDSVIDMRPADVANKAIRIRHGVAVRRQRRKAHGQRHSARHDEDDRRAAAEEVLVELAEQYPTLKEAGLIRRLIRAIKAWIMENMPNARQFLAMSDEDLIANHHPGAQLDSEGQTSRGGRWRSSVPTTAARTVRQVQLDKIGTERGAGLRYGLYFASKKEIAEHYREALSNNMSGPPRRFFRGVELNRNRPSTTLQRLSHKTDAR